jgi:hypothetical protein
MERAIESHPVLKHRSDEPEGVQYLGWWIIGGIRIEDAAAVFCRPVTYVFAFGEWPKIGRGEGAPSPFIAGKREGLFLSDANGSSDG